MKQLPEGFLWGGATADFQYEGGFNNVPSISKAISLYSIRLSPLQMVVYHF